MREFLRKLWVYPVIGILWIIEGSWRAKRYAKLHPEKGI